MFFYWMGLLLYTPQFIKLNRSRFGGRTDFKQDNVDYTCKNCYVPRSGNCSMKCIVPLTCKDYTEEFLTFFRDEGKAIT